MLTANLLPKEEKEVTMHRAFERLSIFFTLCFIAVFFLGGILLLPSYLPLFLSLKERTHTLAVEEEAANQLKVRQLRTEIEETRRVISSLQSFFEPRAGASALLEELFRRSQNITIQSLIIDKTAKISLQGRANTRQDLLLFEKSLRESELLQELSLPLSQIVRETNISFILQGKLKPEKTPIRP
ncbi:MAG: hypothetical protein HYT37_03710 [Candidatus Sungbacteria bacterium]|nr:hypothetical protein [Candidatus Sungbacteria bacterium]